MTAEGVEEHRQFTFLRDTGCDTIQGYLVGRPVEASLIPPFFEYDARLTAQVDSFIESEAEREHSGGASQGKIYNFAYAKLSKSIIKA